MNSISLNKSTATIGIFDSGLGGLTILNTLNHNFPNYKYIYFGDTAHLPYGTKSKKSIIKFCDKIVGFLISKGANIIIIACHSASSVAIDFLKKKYKIPIIGVILPSIHLALKSTVKNSICVLGTFTTITSKTYSNTIKQLYSNIKVHEIPCPLFAPIVEEGLENSQISSLIIQMYLQPIHSLSVDILILGCTHYPILINDIKKYIPNDIIIINTSQAISSELQKILLNYKSLDRSHCNDFFVSDFSYRFNELASKFLTHKINNVQEIEL